MNCDSVNGYIMKYFDKNLNDIESAQMKQHLKSCEKCSAEFEGMSEIFNVLEAENQIEPPTDFEFSVMEKIISLDFEQNKRKDRFLIMLYSLISISIALISLLLSLYFNSLANIGVINSLIGQFSTVSSTLFVFYEVAGKLANSFFAVIKMLFQTFFILLKTYSYVFTILFGILLILDSMFRKLTRQDDGGVG